MTVEKRVGSLGLAGACWLLRPLETVAASASEDRVYGLPGASAAEEGSCEPTIPGQAVVGRSRMGLGCVPPPQPTTKGRD